MALLQPAMDMQALKESLEDYYRTGRADSFMHQSSAWIMQYCQNRLCHDPDVVGDFYLYFYERAHLCLDRYRIRQNLPFVGYLATYLRHEFYNFRRRSQKTIETVLFESMEDLRSETTAPAPEADIEALPRDTRLAYKLHRGLRLHLTDLRQLIELCGDARRAAQVMTDFQLRLEANQGRARHLQERVIQLQRRIEKEDDTLRYSRIRRFKDRALGLIGKTGIVFSVTDLSQIFGVNKSTISRKLKAAEALLSRPQLKEA
ncbi:MAG: hypothetical protein HS115_04000 [Spirochaetales bacterium]|nr:hypothetical protein [Spirochaetales bacterium]